MRPDRVQPAIVGGLVMGVLSALPIVSAGNICCCLWLISGGIVAAYILQQNQATPITTADGATVGLYAGIVGAVVDLVLSIPVSFVTGPYERLAFQRLIDMGGVSGEFGDYVTYYGTSPLRLGFMFVMMLILGTIFATLGGVIGALIFRKPLPPGTIDVTPVPPAA